MSIGPQRPSKGGGSVTDPRLDTFLSEMPVNELFYKNSSDQMEGSGFIVPNMKLPSVLVGTDSSSNFKPFTFSPLAQQIIASNSEQMIRGMLGIEIPENVSELINDVGYITLSQVPSSTAQVNTDWNSNSGISQLLNKPILFSGAYADLSGKPVLFSGNYADLTGKPTLFDGTYTSLTGKPTTFTPSAHTHAISDITGLQASLDGKATTASLSGYVTSSSLTTSLGGYATTTALTTGLSAKFNTPVGNTTQYIRGDGSIATFPAIPTVPSNVSAFTNDSGYLTNIALTGLRKVETFLGTTDASGNVTINFANTYATPPDVQPQIIGGTFNQSVRVVSISTTGCVVQAAQRNLVTLLSIEVLLGATVNLVGASVTVQVTPRS